MTLVNRGWISFDGTPVTGLPPPVLWVQAPPGVQASPQQLAETAHVYKLFCDALRVMPGDSPYLAQNYKLHDGSTVRMTAIGGVHVVLLRVNGGVPEPKLPRSFAIRSMWPAASDVEKHYRKPRVLRYHSKWKYWPIPPRPGNTDTTPTYFVDTMSSARYGRLTESDRKYFDVYTLFNSVIYEDEFPAFEVPSVGVPIIVHAADNGLRRVFVFDNTDWLKMVDDEKSMILVFSAGTSFNVLVPGNVFQPAVRYERVPRKVGFAMYNLTPADVLQIWYATTTLLTAPPWYLNSDTTFFQTQPSPYTNLPTGYDVTTQPTTRIWDITDPETMLCWWIYSVPPTIYDSTGYYLGKIYGNDLRSDSLDSILKYNHSHGDSEEFVLFSNWIGKWSRSISISASVKDTQSLWNVISPVSVYCDSVGSPQGYQYRQLPGSFNQAPYLPGVSSVGPYYSESAWVLRETDSATLTASAGNLQLYTAGISHSTNHDKGHSTESRGVSVPPASWQCGGGGSPVAGFLRQFDLYRNSFTGVQVDNRDEHYHVDATSRDYIYYDLDEDVAAWIEAHLSGTKDVVNGVISGTTSLTVTLKFRAREFSAAAQVGSYQSGPVYVATQSPDVQQTDVPWVFASPKRVLPIFAPLWQTQGACPRIAYTVTGESAVLIAMCSLRIQIAQVQRSPFRDPPLLAEGTDRTSAFMLEQMLQSHWPVDPGDLYMELETVQIKLDAVTPGVSIGAELGLPEADTRWDNFYRV